MKLTTMQAWILSINMILISCLSSKQPYLSAGLSLSGPYRCLGPCLPIDEGGGVEEAKAAGAASSQSC